MASIDKRDNRVERVVPLAVFSAEIEKALGLSYGMTPEDLEILLVHLSRDQKYLAHDQSVVKLKGKGEERADITAEDINIASLKSLMVGLHVQLEELTQKISNYEKKARSAVAAKNRVLATASLRSKKLYESILAQRSETLAQLEGVYFTLEEASDQLEIVRVMQASTKILKGLRLEIGGMDTVEHVLEALTTEMNHVDGIGAVMSENAQVNNMVDESVIDEELDALERQDQRRKDEQGASETEKRLELLGGPNPTKSDFTPIGHSEPSESISQRKRTSTKDRQRETDESQQPEEFTQQREFLITS
ncbi:hypothetical protein MMC13_000908 [Lambiella insularis]|nr:hypothetical protein [Lambiella insularis]